MSGQLRLLSAVFPAVISFGTCRAEDVTAVHRVFGLFSADREADLRVAAEKLPEIKLVSIDMKYGEATFTYDLAKAFKETKPENLIERFNHLLRSASSQTFGIEPLRTTPKDQLIPVEIPVAGLDCKACALAAYEAVAKVDGVQQAAVSFKEGRVSALIDAAKTNAAALTDALKKKGVELPVK